ncbi:glycosyltransferase [Streptococcus iniae]
MIEITNGADTHSLKIKKYEQNYSKISLVAVGTIYPYHGYDRILKGLKAINEEYNQKVIEINFIGKSSTLDDLKKLSEKLELKNVYFHGTKTTEELNDLYDKFDLGLGCLALHRRDADIDTTIKVIEYYCRGVAVLTSGDSPLGEIFSNTTIKIASNEDIIDLNYVLSEFEKITQSDMQQISQLSINKFSWNKIIFDLN